MKKEIENKWERESKHERERLGDNKTGQERIMGGEMERGSGREREINGS